MAAADELDGQTHKCKHCASFRKRKINVDNYLLNAFVCRLCPAPADQPHSSCCFVSKNIIIKIETDRRTR